MPSNSGYFDSCLPYNLVSSKKSPVAVTSFHDSRRFVNFVANLFRLSVTKAIDSVSVSILSSSFFLFSFNRIPFGKTGKRRCAIVVAHFMAQISPFTVVTHHYFLCNVSLSNSQFHFCSIKFL